jgi:hypothetical protein
MGILSGYVPKSEASPEQFGGGTGEASMPMRESLKEPGGLAVDAQAPSFDRTGISLACGVHVLNLPVETYRVSGLMIPA